MCSQQSKLGLNTKEEDPDLKYTLKKDDLGVLAGKQYFSSQDYSNHNKQALGEMDKKIKDNIKALEDDLKLAKKHTPDLVKHIKLPSENSEFAKYKEMFANYFPVKISSTEELQTIFKKEFEDFKISDLNRVPVHVMMLTLGGLAPFLVPLADLVLLHGYSASMESIQVGTRLELAKVTQLLNTIIVSNIQASSSEDQISQDFQSKSFYPMYYLFFPSLPDHLQFHPPNHRGRNTPLVPYPRHLQQPSIQGKHPLNRVPFQSSLAESAGTQCRFGTQQHRVGASAAARRTERDTETALVQVATLPCYFNSCCIHVCHACGESLFLGQSPMTEKMFNERKTCHKYFITVWGNVGLKILTTKLWQQLQ